MNPVAERRGGYQERDLSTSQTLLQGPAVPSLVPVIEMSKDVQSLNNRGGRKEEREPPHGKRRIIKNIHTTLSILGRLKTQKLQLGAEADVGV